MDDYLIVRTSKFGDVICSKEDFELVSKYKWWVTKTNSNNYYAITIIDKKYHYMHRLIMGEGPYLCDHKNKNGLDNRRCNLRKSTKSQNTQNSRKYKRPTSSKYRGVYFYKAYGKWSSSIRVNTKRVFIGYFKDEEEAARQYDKNAIKYFGEFASLNFPDHST